MSWHRHHRWTPVVLALIAVLAVGGRTTPESARPSPHAAEPRITGTAWSPATSRGAAADTPDTAGPGGRAGSVPDHLDRAAADRLDRAASSPSAPASTPRRSARLADQSPMAAPPAPVRLRIPRLDVDAPILPVGVRDGELAVVDDAVHVGWYRHGPAPGQPGSAVLAAHVDTAADGPGVFFHLDVLRPGDDIEVEAADGSIRHFSVEHTTRHPKAALPVDALFARDGDPRVALITCGGAFDRVSRRYADNLVVVATPASRPAAVASR